MTCHYAYLYVFDVTYATSRIPGQTRKLIWSYNFVIISHKLEMNILHITMHAAFTCCIGMRLIAICCEQMTMFSACSYRCNLADYNLPHRLVLLLVSSKVNQRCFKTSMRHCHSHANDQQTKGEENTSQDLTGYPIKQTIKSVLDSFQQYNPCTFFYLAAPLQSSLHLVFFLQ